MSRLRFPMIRIGLDGPQLIEYDGSESLGAAVGGLVQAIDLCHPQTGEPLTVWLGEEAKLRPQSAWFNPLANALVAAFGENVLRRGDYIAGPIVLTGFNKDTGEAGPIPYAWANALLAGIGYVT